MFRILWYLSNSSSVGLNWLLHFLFIYLFFSVIFQGRVLEGSFWFAILLNFKHLFLYLAPAYFVYLLRTYCFRSSADKKKGMCLSCKIKDSLGFIHVIIMYLVLFSERQFKLLGVNLWDFSPVNLLKLGFVVVTVFAISFGPFIAMVSLVLVDWQMHIQTQTNKQTNKHVQTDK